MTDQQSQWCLGDSSKWYESANKGAGTISSGVGDKGGVSYGQYQLSTTEGAVQEYLNQSKYKQYFEDKEPGTGQFNEEWKKLAKTDPSFAEDQHEFIKSKYYDIQNESLKQAGIDLSARSPAVQDLLWSTSVQFKDRTPGIFEKGIKEKFGENYDLAKLSDKDIIDAVQDYKINHNEGLFKNSSENIKTGTLARAHAEKADLEKFAETGQPVDHHARHSNHEHVLHQGSHGQAVRELQQHLNDLGYTDSKGKPLAVNGNFDRNTHNALEAFQHDNHMTADGKAGSKTLGAIDTKIEQHNQTGPQTGAAPTQAAPPASGPSQNSPGSPSRASPLMDPDLQAIYNSNGNPAVMAQSAQNYQNSPSGQLFNIQAQTAAAQVPPNAPEQQQAAQAPGAQEGPSISR